MPRPCTYVGRNITQNERKRIHGYLKGKSSILIYQKYANIKFKYRNREFWCRGYFVDTVGKSKKAIQEYIANQIQEDKKMEQMTIFEKVDPFKK